MEKLRPSSSRCPEAAAAAALESGRMDEDELLPAAATAEPTDDDALPASLLTLPAEIHAHILSYLDLMDVLNYAQACT